MVISGQRRAQTAAHIEEEFGEMSDELENEMLRKFERREVMKAFER